MAHFLILSFYSEVLLQSNNVNGSASHVKIVAYRTSPD